MDPCQWSAKRQRYPAFGEVRFPHCEKVERGLDGEEIDFDDEEVENFDSGVYDYEESTEDINVILDDSIQGTLV